MAVVWFSKYTPSTSQVVVKQQILTKSYDTTPYRSDINGGISKQQILTKSYDTTPYRIATNCGF